MIYNQSMKFLNIFRIMGIIFISITALLLILTIFNLIGSNEVKDAIIKLATASAVVALASILISSLATKK